MIRQHIAQCSERDRLLRAQLQKIERSVDRANARWMALAAAVIMGLLAIIGYLLIDGPPWREHYHIEELAPLDAPPEDFLPYRRRPGTPTT